jgi:glutathionyl-hydroquinone reductase
MLSFFLGLFCPFAQRANIVRHLYSLTYAISLSVVKPYPRPWTFAISDEEYPGATVDHIYGDKTIKDIYDRADRNYKGKYSVPVLWDKKTQTIVNNVISSSFIFFQGVC